MRVPPHQQVSDLLHEIADLVNEADLYLSESGLYKSSVKSLPKSKAQLASVGEPNKSDRVANRLRNTMEKLSKPERDVFRAKRERKQRSRYQARKLVKGAPRKSFGSRFRKR